MRREASVSVVPEHEAASALVRVEEAALLILRSAESLFELDGRPVSVVVALLGDAELRDLNNSWRGRDRPTDVLSFSQLEDAAVDPSEDTDFAEPLPTGSSTVDGAAADSFREMAGESDNGAETCIGDVIVSVDTALRQATDGGWSLEEEVHRLVLHGILHLLGYDHENDEAEARQMRSEEQRLAGMMIAAGIPCAHEGPVKEPGR